MFKLTTRKWYKGQIVTELSVGGTVVGNKVQASEWAKWIGMLADALVKEDEKSQ